MQYLKSINWAKVIGSVLASAATGFASTGVWQGAAAGAAIGLANLFMVPPQPQPAAPPPAPEQPKP